MIAIHNLYKTFDPPQVTNTLFHGLNLNIEAGQALTLLGPNGCGKSTLLNLITGIDRNYTGQIWVKGSLEKNPFNVAYMQQKNLLLPWLTVEENILLGLGIQNKLNDDILHQIDKYLNELKIFEKRHCYPTRLSGGEKQKVALIRTLVLNTPVLLLDEPFSAIDCWTREDLQKLILTHIQEKRTTLLLVTHDIEEAIIMSDRILVLNEKARGIHLDLNIQLSPAERNPQAPRTTNFNGYYNAIKQNHPLWKNC